MKISDVKNSANPVAGIRRSSMQGRFLDTFCRPGQKVSIMQAKRWKTKLSIKYLERQN